MNVYGELKWAREEEIIVCFKVGYRSINSAALLEGLKTLVITVTLFGVK
jgi:hypothetical protein